MDALPGDVIVEILFHIHNELDFCTTAVNTACTNKFFSSVIRSDLIWRKALNIFFKVTPNRYDLGNCKRLFFGYVTAKPVDGFKLVLNTDRSTTAYGEIMHLTTTLINTQSIKAAIGIAMGYRHFLNDGSAYTVQYSFSSKVGVHRFVSERELTTGHIATRLKEQNLEPYQSVQFTTQALLRRETTKPRPHMHWWEKSPELNAFEVPFEDGKVPLKKNRLQFKEGYIELEKKEVDQLAYDFYSNSLTTPRARPVQPPKTKYTVYLQVRLSHLVGFNTFGRRETTTVYSNIVPLTIDLTRSAVTPANPLVPKMASPTSERTNSVKRKAEGEVEEHPPAKKSKF